MKPAFRTLGNSLLAATIAAVLVACSDDEQGPAPLTPPDLTGCAQVQVSDTLELVAHLYARGVQIYRWNGATWDFISPSATLFPSGTDETAIGYHYSGPTWEGLDGSKVVGTVIDKCTPDGSAIPWLVLSGTPSGNWGEFGNVTRIQRVNTTGGKAPADGNTVGQVASVAYTTDYYFHAPR